MILKIPLAKLEVARKSPIQFVLSAKKKDGDSDHFGFSRWMAWLNAVHFWNKNNSENSAIKYLTDSLSHFKIVQNNPEEGEYYIEKLQAYIKAHSKCGFYNLESRHRISITLNSLVVISAQIPLVVMNKDIGYSILLLSQNDLSIDTELRWPILQNHYSSVVYGVDISEINVGYFNFEREMFVTKSFTQNKVKKCLKELNDMGEIMYKNLL